MDLCLKKINFNYLLHENNTIDNPLYLPENNLYRSKKKKIKRKHKGKHAIRICT